MFEYLICFGISVSLLYISNYTKHGLKKIVVFIALIIPCVLAGIRSLEIGTDVLVYLKSMFECSKEAGDYSGFLNYKISGNRYAYKYEMGFTFFVYAVSVLFRNIHVLMFAIEVMIVFPIYFGCKKIKFLENKTWLCMLVYYFLFFNVGLNAMREFIGLSFAFYGICSILSKEKNGFAKYIISSIIAYLFHKSSILSVSIVFVYYLLRSNKSIVYKRLRISNKTIKTALIIGMSLFILFNMNIFNNILYSNDQLIRYTAYYNGNVYFSITNVTRIFPIIILGIILLKKFNKKNEDALFYITIFLFGYMIFGQLNNASLYGDRISNIYKMISVITFPILSFTPSSKKGKRISTCIIIAYVIFYWWFMYVYRGYHHTIPFVIGI